MYTGINFIFCELFLIKTMSSIAYSYYELKCERLLLTKVKIVELIKCLFNAMQRVNEG